MSQSSSYQPTPEQLARWKRMDELEPTATVGFLSIEQQDKNVKEFLETDYIQNQLEQTRAYKAKLLKKLASAEEYEQFLLKENQKRM
ncbi:MAG: hypothetical protein HC836_21970 [Richelia sp. RM2_1_2]|nr:hypothetical protein [Richelia sp. SM2_1_7]NJM18851.1 hypothetical protein [Richelia sp. SM1_7_0]NJN10324.1 hypothetical protein [Richelia sp. RM1_1_1]NJO28124.1 hypothetical protein [Richelia sp. SL_2_1]NJO60824.1 hypothetical protein [Richelia sp. RM2_1_2]